MGQCVSSRSYSTWNWKVSSTNIIRSSHTTCWLFKTYRRESILIRQRTR